MRWNEMFSLRLSELIAKHIQLDKEIQLLVEEKSLQESIASVINKNFQEEKDLNREVEKMMDDLEDQGETFERHKMRPLIKSRLAKKRGFVL